MKTYLAGALLLVAAPAAAQEAWQFAITPYAYLPGVTAKLNTDFGERRVPHERQRGDHEPRLRVHGRLRGAAWKAEPDR